MLKRRFEARNGYAAIFKEGGSWWVSGKYGGELFARKRSSYTDCLAVLGGIGHGWKLCRG